MIEIRRCHIVAHVSSQLRVPLRAGVAGDNQLTEVDSWSQFWAAMRRHPVDLVVVDPCVESSINHTQSRPFARLFDWLPKTLIVMYAALTPASARTIVDLADRNIAHLVVHTCDDTPERWCATISRLMRQVDGSPIPSAILRAMRGLPQPLLDAFAAAFARPHALMSMSTVARYACVNLRTIYRTLDRFGLESPRRILIAARLCRAHRYFTEPAYTVQHVADKLGYADTRMLHRHTSLALGLTPRQLRRGISEQWVATRLAQWIRPACPCGTSLALV